MSILKSIPEPAENLQLLDFRPQSADCVRMTPSHAGMIPDRVSVAAKRLQPAGGKKRVGVFADEMMQNVITRAYNYRLDYILLAGNESDIYIRNLRATLVPDICPLIQIIKKQ